MTSIHADEFAAPGSAGTPLLSIDGLSKRYTAEGPLACRELSFSVEEGELVAIVGPSGCGKSTMLRMISGLLAPTTGEVRIDGDLVTAPLQQVALVFQDYTRSLFPWLDVRRNVGFPLVKRRDISKGDKRERVLDAIRTVGLEGFESYRPAQLSGGMQQRVALARALAFRPSIMLLDEPFASVDALTREGLEDTLLYARDTESGARTTMLLVTHDIDEAIYIADRILVLTDPPSRIRTQLTVDLPRPRNQITTRSDPEFLRVREAIHEIMGLTAQRAEQPRGRSERAPSRAESDHSSDDQTPIKEQ